MNDYKAVRSSLDISRSIAFYLEMSDPAAFRQADRAGSIRTINDILQGRSERTVEAMLAELEQKGGTYYAREIAVLRQNIQDFQHQKMMLTQPYSERSSKAYNDQLIDKRSKDFTLIIYSIYSISSRGYSFFQIQFTTEIDIVFMTGKVQSQTTHCLIRHSKTVLGEDFFTCQLLSFRISTSKN